MWSFRSRSQRPIDYVCDPLAQIACGCLNSVVAAVDSKLWAPA
jgi:hypothetical protein